MQYKLDTKEKFHVITPQIDNLSANVAAELIQQIMQIAVTVPYNVILNCTDINSADVDALHFLVDNVRIKLYEENKSFVTCCLSANLTNLVTELELEEALNVTPTESEAWDIVQMDEIEREFLGDEE